jgi:FlaA1/EpsC-like NDP-sugar epimerase
MSNSKEVNSRHSFLKIGVDMIKENQKMLIGLHVLMDACTIIVAYLFAYYIRFYSLFVTNNSRTFYPLGKYTVLLIYLVPMYIFIYYVFRLYTPKRGKRKRLGIFNIILSNIFGIAFFTFTLYFQKEVNISRKFLILFFIINVVLGVSSRMLVSYTLKATRRKG